MLRPRHRHGRRSRPDNPSFIEQRLFGEERHEHTFLLRPDAAAVPGAHQQPGAAARALLGVGRTSVFDAEGRDGGAGSFGEGVEGVRGGRTGWTAGVPVGVRRSVEESRVRLFQVSWGWLVFCEHFTVEFRNFCNVASTDKFVFIQKEFLELKISCHGYVYRSPIRRANFPF